MKHSKEDLAKALDEIEKNLLAAVQNEALAKSEDVEKCGDVTAKAEEAPGEAMDDEIPEASAGEQSVPESAPQESPAPEASAEPDVDEMQDEPVSVEQLAQAYAALSPEELAMHEQALQQVKMSQQAPEAASQGQSASPGPGAQAPGAGEGSAALAPGSEMALKSEKLSAELEGLKKSQSALVDALKVLIGAPQRKGFTGVDMVPAAVSPAAEVSKLSKTEINDRLKKKARENLAKSDRELIRSFYNKEAKVEEIAHLLK